MLENQQSSQLRDEVSLGGCDNGGMDSEWAEIPLSDEDEQPSPRGVLQFRKSSESDSMVAGK